MIHETSEQKTMSDHWDWEWTRKELRYWYERLLCALGIIDERLAFRPYHLWRMIRNK